MVRVADKGELYVHQDANWNVIGTSDMGGRLVERNYLSPYGQLTVFQETGFGDRDGDQDVDATDKGTPGTTCTTLTGKCRVLDLDFDGDYDSADATLFDALPQGYMATPGLLASATDQPFAHQGLLYEPEIGSYQNRARQYDPGKRRFLRRDPEGIRDQNLNVFEHVHANPFSWSDPMGMEALPQDAIGTPCSIGQGFDICNYLRQADANGENWFDRDGSQGISFCCYRINPEYGWMITCLGKACFDSLTPHQCVQQHEMERLNRMSCGMHPTSNDADQCTDMRCTRFTEQPAWQLDCEVYRKTFQCYEQLGLGVLEADCLLHEMCVEHKTVEEAWKVCGD